MNVGDIYPSKWLRAADLGGRSHQLTIVDVDMGIVGQGDDAKNQLIVTFRGLDKPLGLNKTNAAAIAAVYGEETDDWFEHEVIIFPTQVTWNGQMTDCIRVDLKGTQRLVQAALRARREPTAPHPIKPVPRPAPASPVAVAPAKVAPMTQAEVDTHDAMDEVPF